MDAENQASKNGIFCIYLSGKYKELLRRWLEDEFLLIFRWDMLVICFVEGVYEICVYK